MNRTTTAQIKANYCVGGASFGRVDIERLNARNRAEFMRIGANHRRILGGKCAPWLLVIFGQGRKWGRVGG